jgi:hypothetical protein
MIVVQALLMMGVAGAQIRMYPLDERSVVKVRLSKDEPTTCVFPGAIKALVGANVSAKADENPGVLLSHPQGTEYFSLRALKDDATGALNVLHRGRVYALAFVTVAEEPDRAVVFLDEPLAGGTRAKPSLEAMRMLLDRAKQFDRLKELYPGVAVTAQRSQPHNKTLYREFTAIISDIIRFEAEDVIVFRVMLENAGPKPVQYDPHGLAVRVGFEVFPAEYAEATGAIPPNASVPVYFLVTGSGAHGRANLPVTEHYSVIVPLP